MGSAYFDAHSLWKPSGQPLLTSLTANVEAETCVIGAGVAGLSVAYQLLKAGRSVVVLDRERIGLGETGLSSAHLSNALDAGYARLQREHGRQGVRLAAESHTQAIDEIETIVRAESIACDFKRVPGYLFLNPEHSIQHLREELAAVHAAGLIDVQLIDRAPSELIQTGPCLSYPQQAQLNPSLYINGLVDAILRRGGHIFTHSEASEIKGGPDAFVRTKQGATVYCENIVVATHVPINNFFYIHNKNPAYRTYVVGIPCESMNEAEALYWETGAVYHYLRFANDPATNTPILLVGGEDHRTGHDTHSDAHFYKLEQWIKNRLGINPRPTVLWSGQIIQAIDGLAYIGPNPGDEGNVFIVTGDHGHGLTHGTIAGLLLRDMILQQPNAWAALYEPERLHFRSMGTYLKEATQTTSGYGDWLSESDVHDVQQIEPGEGAVLRQGLRKTAVYKDESGRLYSYSAACPHLGGVVRWNSAEKTWDCACHGSRFCRFGSVINGPAHHDLTPTPDPIATVPEILLEL